MPSIVKDRARAPSAGRRRFLAGAVGLAAVPARAQLVLEQYPAIPGWAYNAAVPAPTMRLRQGERLRVRLEKGLEEGTTVHWHGIRLRNAMDGVPDLTQPLVDRGQSFEYESNLPPVEYLSESRIPSDENQA